MNARDTTPPDGPARTLRAHYLALLMPLILQHMLQIAGGLLDGFLLWRRPGRRVLGLSSPFLAMLVLHGLY